MEIHHTSQSNEPWNKGKSIGQKPPLNLKDIRAIRIRLQLGQKVRDLALFNLAIDSKLRSCDLAKLRLSDVSHEANGFACDGDTAEDRPSCPARDHPSDARGSAGLDHPCRSEGLGSPIHQPSVELAPPVDEAVRQDCPSLGGGSWPRVWLLRHPHYAQDQHADRGSCDVCLSTRSRHAAPRKMPLTRGVCTTQRLYG